MINSISNHLRRLNIDRINNFLFISAVIYYWLYLYIQLFLPKPTESFLGYFFAVAPIFVISLLGTAYSLGSRKITNQKNTPLVFLWLFFVVVFFVSLYRFDYSNARQAILMCLVLTWLCSLRQPIGIKFLNTLFLLSIGVSSIFFYTGLSEYGVFSSFATDPGHAGMWRVSIFPFLPESAFFSLIIIMLNWNCTKGIQRVVYCAIALYFMIFSGIRSAAICLVLGTIFIYMARFFDSSNGSDRLKRRTIIGLLVIFLFFTVILGAGILKFVPGINGSIVGNYIFKEVIILDDDALSKSVYRYWLWKEHFNLFLRNIWVGIGSYDFKQTIGYGLINDFEQTGSESFVTRKLSELGLLFLPFFVFLWMEFKRVAVEPGPLRASLLIVLFIAMLSYGSIIVPYNLIFLLFFSLILCGDFRLNQ